MSPIVSEQYEFVIGVDTHAATHTFAVVAGATGAALHRATFPTSTPGLARAFDWLNRHVADRSTLVVVEGTGSFGAIVTGRLQAAGFTVVEAARMAAVSDAAPARATSSTRSGSPGRFSGCH